jgi:hypothetical protein
MVADHASAAALAERAGDDLRRVMKDLLGQGLVVGPEVLQVVRESVIKGLLGHALSDERLFSHDQIVSGVYVGRDLDDPYSIVVDFARYKHDCSRCEFLGCYENFDLYRCKDSPGRLTNVVARYGDEAHEYVSLLSGSEQDIPGGQAAFEAIRIGFRRSEEVR